MTLLAQVQDRALELQRLRAVLATINSEAKADLDQIQMLQEAIKANARTSLEAQWRSPDPVMFEDNAAAQRRMIQRDSAINARLESILERSAALEVKKQLILDRILEVSAMP
jgi:hypothetical protein